MSPAYCTLNVTAVWDDALDDVLTFDDSTQTFTLAEITDSLALSGSEDDPIATKKKWTITMIYEIYSLFSDTLTKTDSTDFKWKFKNPCVDEDFTKVI